MNKCSYVLLSCMLGAGSAFAQCSVYVAPYGSDSNPGSAAAPLATPQAAVNAAAPGAVICFRGGSYEVKSYFGIGKPVTLMSVPGEWAILWADNSGTSTVNNVIDIGANNVTVQQLEVSGGAYYGIKISPDLLGSAPANVHILQTKVHETGRDAIKAYEADGLLIEGNEVYNSGRRDSSNAEGIDVMGSIPTSGDPNGWGVVIRRNYIHNTATFGLYLKGGTRRGLVEANRIDQAGGSGLGLGQDSGQEYMRDGALYECIDCTAINNVVSNTTYAGIVCSAGWNIRIENNTAVNVANVGQAGLYAVPNHNNLGCGNASFRNNAVSVSSSRPLVHVVQPSGPLTFDYNAYYNTTGAAQFWWEGSTGDFYWNSIEKWRAGTGQDLNSLVAALQLDADLKPLAGSPLVDRGVTISDIPLDFAGTSRPQGAAYEIGAYEAPVAPAPSPLATTTTMQDGSLKAARRPQKYTLTAQVATGGGPVTSGTVLFTVDGATAGSANLVNGTASLAYTFQRTAAGTRYSLQAYFGGTSTLKASASNIATLTITP